MATRATQPVLVSLVSSLRPGAFFPRFMAIGASRPVDDLVLRFVGLSVPMEFRLLVAVQAEHFFLVMDIRHAAIFSRKLGVDPASVAEGAGLALVLLYEAMAFDKSDTDAADDGSLDMAVTTGGMAASARLLENLRIEDLDLRFREPPDHPGS